MHIPLALTHFRIKHKDYLIFTEPLALGTLLNSVYYKTLEWTRRTLRIPNKSTCGSKLKLGYSAVVSDYTSVENQEIWLPHHRFWRAGWSCNELRRLSFIGTVQIFKMYILKQHNFFINVLIFICGSYSVASLGDNGECLYNEDMVYVTWIKLVL